MLDQNTFCVLSREVLLRDLPLNQSRQALAFHIPLKRRRKHVGSSYVKYFIFQKKKTDTLNLLP